MSYTSTRKDWKYGDTTPFEMLNNLAKHNNMETTDKKFYQWLDKNDKLSHLRDQFFIPQLATYPTVKIIDDEFKDCIYLCGQSLGLQAKKTSEIVDKVLQNWRERTILCHEMEPLPAICCDKYVFESMSKLVGAYEDEIVVMNGLTVNLHLLLVSFYQPSESRHKILLEAKAFPSDHYAIESQIKQRGYNPEESMLLVEPQPGKEIWSTESILRTIEREGDSIALVMLSGVHYYTGYVFDMESITKAAHAKGCKVGFDLAHAVGNIELSLHDWDVDFACWCTYKYLNSGPGCLSGCFMHDKHKNNNFPKFLGWFGHKEETRFEMRNQLDIIPGIQGYRISNPPPLLVACIRASLDVFDQTNVRELREKSFLLTGYLELLLKHYFAKGKSDPYIDIITPSDFKHRGCQLSLVFSSSVSEIHNEMKQQGVICDFRHPNVIRIAPVPIYNSFCDVYRFVDILRKVCATSSR